MTKKWNHCVLSCVWLLCIAIRLPLSNSHNSSLKMKTKQNKKEAYSEEITPFFTLCILYTFYHSTCSIPKTYSDFWYIINILWRKDLEKEKHSSKGRIVYWKLVLLNTQELPRQWVRHLFLIERKGMKTKRCKIMPSLIKKTDLD